MKTILLVTFLSILILSFTALFEVNYLNYSSPIPYSQIKTITFSDFKGLKKPAQTLDGMQEFAFISTSRELKLTSNNTAIVTTFFHPSRSYVFNKHLRNFDLLSHELYHFRISEYVTRLFRKKIFEHQGDLTSSLIDGFKTKFYDLEEEMQYSYDDESYHSYAFNEQKKWEVKIDSSLKSLEKFRDTLVTNQK